MSRRLAVPLAVLAMLVAAILVAAGSAAATTSDPPVVLAPDDAQIAIDGPESGGLTATTVVDGATALAAASAPGADTEAEPDLSPDEAVGLAPLPGGSGAPAGGGSLATTGNRSICWANAAWHQWGTWPYEQRITDTTYWCAVLGVKITYRTSSVTIGGTLCGYNWRASQLIGGGVGFPFFTMRSSAGFSCPTVIPWITLHPSHHVDVRRDDRGGATFVGSG